MADKSSSQHVIFLQVFSVLFSLLFFFSAALAYAALPPEKANGVYFPSGSLSGRRFDAILHYMQAAHLNLAVLHAKDPEGRLFWLSEEDTAVRMQASSGDTLRSAIIKLKNNGIWTAAKLDVFQDSLLVHNFPELGVKDAVTGELWEDHKGLHWANPYDKRVWDYNLSLCAELIKLGIDEIQFDYIRFPSDGDMTRIMYPNTMKNTSREECIGKFLEYAKTRLKPDGIIISVDLFGLIAWKTEDFGVGQVLEKIAPHCDVICPMLYPSHFPENFLNMDDPGRYPYKIMKQSLAEMKLRTDKMIRPWIQGFWYTPQEIQAQFDGVEENEISSWTVWHPSGRYLDTFTALELQEGTKFPPPVFYPELDSLRTRDDLIFSGRNRVINHTSYRKGYSILSLDTTVPGKTNDFASILQVVSTLDESITDRILDVRDLAYNTLTGSYAKAIFLAELIQQDLAVDPRRMQPFPIYVDWEGDCIFSRSIPPPRLESYLSVSMGKQSR